MGKEDGYKPVDAQCKEKCMVTCPILSHLVLQPQILKPFKPQTLNLCSGPALIATRVFCASSSLCQRSRRCLHDIGRKDIEGVGVLLSSLKSYKKYRRASRWT